MHNKTQIVMKYAKLILISLISFSIQAQSDGNFLRNVERFYEANRHYELLINMTTYLNSNGNKSELKNEVNQATDGMNFYNASNEFVFLQTSEYLIKLDKRKKLIYVGNRAKNLSDNFLNVRDLISFNKMGDNEYLGSENGIHRYKINYFYASEKNIDHIIVSVDEDYHIQSISMFFSEESGSPVERVELQFTQFKLKPDFDPEKFNAYKYIKNNEGEIAASTDYSDYKVILVE